MLAEEKYEKSDSSEMSLVSAVIGPSPPIRKTSIDFLDQFYEEVKKMEVKEKIKKNRKKEQKAAKKLDKIGSKLAKLDSKAKSDYEKIVDRLSLLQKELLSTGSSVSSRTILTKDKQEKVENGSSPTVSPGFSDSIVPQLTEIDQKLDFVLYKIGQIQAHRKTVAPYGEIQEKIASYEIQRATETAKKAIDDMQNAKKALKDIEGLPSVFGPDWYISRGEIQFLISSLAGLEIEYKESMTGYNSNVKSEE